MLDRSEESDGKINWPLAVGLSVVFHVVVLGLFWLVLGGSASKAPAPSDEPETLPPPEEVRAAAKASAGTADETGTPAPRPVGSAPASSRAGGSGSGSTASAPVSEAVTEYTVKSGDHLWRIATNVGCTVADLRRLNGDAVKKTLHPGQVIKVPAKR